MVAVLGKENAEEASGHAGGAASSSNNAHGRGERVMSFRKQGEYGARKYIKP